MALGGKTRGTVEKRGCRYGMYMWRIDQLSVRASVQAVHIYTECNPSCAEYIDASV